ncbi:MULTISPECIES: hypothetical protein [unclassified Tolypothrix]|nr:MULTISPECIES: hypothetical protein [unclassified Tolypothrix]EKF01244.1 hypothetical protein FDUTEX481_08125 [Tolypothrix sp. PCC 7601]
MLITAVWRSLLWMRNTHLLNSQKNFEHLSSDAMPTPLMPD